MAGTLKGKRIAILATDGFEQSELVEPKKALEEAGAKTELLSLQKRFKMLRQTITTVCCYQAES